MWSAPFQQLANTGVNHPHWALTCADIRMFSLAAHFFAHRWQLRFRIRILLESVWYVTVTTMTHDHIMMISFFSAARKWQSCAQGLPSRCGNVVHFFYFLWTTAIQWRHGWWIGKEKTWSAASGGPRAHELRIQIEKKFDDKLHSKDSFFTKNEDEICILASVF
jgi:hypothetical protein